MKKLFPSLLLIVVFCSFFLRLFLLRESNIFFTVDQGRDAVFAREILLSHRIFLKGPETNIRGVFAGPLGDYAIALGYSLTGGNPMGGVLIMIISNLAATLLLVLWLRKHIGDSKALFVGLTVQFFWGFFETSLWGFHPFFLVVLSFVLIILLTNFLMGFKKHYWLAAVPILLAFNAEVAGAMALFVFYLAVGIFGVIKKYISVKKFLFIGILIPLSGTLFFGRQFVVSQLSGLGSHGMSTGSNAARVFTGTNFFNMTKEFSSIMGTTILPRNATVGMFGFLMVIFLGVVFRKSFKKEIFCFTVLTFLLTTISYFFFASNNGWRSWHTVFLPPLLFVSVLLITTQIPKKIGVALFALILVLQLINFEQKYLEYLKPSSNPSLLYNELSAIDWVYGQSHDLGFKVYNYTDTFHDYPYQYLFYWYGLNKYGYLPEEYANYPLSPKELYVPGSSKYIEPKRSGENISYLIIQSTTNGEQNSNWIDKFRNYFDLVDKNKIGDIIIEKYTRKSGSPNDPCIWWGKCTF